MKRKFLLAILMLLIYIPLKAETDTLKPYFYLGAYGGVNYNLHSADFKELPGVPNCCPKFETGNGFGFHFGGLFRYPFSQEFSLGINLGYITLNGKLNKDEIIGNTEIRNSVPPYETTDIVKAISNHSVDGNFSAITFEPRFIWNFFDSFRWNIGLQAGFLTTYTFSQRERLISPDNVVFAATDTKTRNEYNDVQLDSKKSFQMFGKTSLGYEIKFAKDWLLVPEIGIALPFTNLYSGSWKVMPINFTLALEIPIKPTVRKDTLFEIKYERDTTVIAKFGISNEQISLISKTQNIKTVEQESHYITTTTIMENYERIIPKNAGIAGNLYIYGIDENGNKQSNPTLTIEEIEVIESFPLLPYVFYKENSSNLKETAMITDNQKAESFKYSELPWETMGIYDNLLNIIKYRMDKFPNAKIKITGTNNNTSEAGNTVLSKNRAETLKDYFINNLKIKPDRIETAYQNLPDKPSNPTIADGIQENQRAEISSKNIDILAPVELSQIEKKANPPIIVLNPEITSTLPISEWKIAISQNGKNIREYSGSGNPGNQQWIVGEEPIPEFETPINFKFIAKDSLGNPLEVNNQINITQKTIKKKREEIQNDTTYQRYSLIVFDFDKSDLTQVHKNILDKIREKIAPNSIVTIYGYADRTGTQQYNKDLTGRRIEEVVKYLKLNNDKVRKFPIGSDEMIFNNDTPQGRSYSRTVKIIIATPIK